VALEPLLIERLKALGVEPSEVRESFARSGGKGGQNVNKVETGVTLSHEKTGVVVRVTDTRSQARNREIAWERFVDALEKAREDRKKARRQAAEKERRRRRKKPRRLREKILETKKRRGETKKLRSRVKE